MSDTPTLETDSNLGFAVSLSGPIRNGFLYTDKDGPFVLAGFARQLERERDEARKERNAALSDRDAWARLCGAADCYTPSTAEPYEALKLQREALRAEVNQLKAERDNWRVSSVCRELNAELERLKAELAAMKGAE